ncbi:MULTISPECIES: hypothetical protein [unclassified Actinoplanes]|uniref:hypothetical protein n=1 Tax=unclassified Actinoplanes TaxID=2626549 RepID=UPI0003027BDD|nr:MULTISPECIES: hypothetical protein [unclassified Actinoplanes]
MERVADALLAALPDFDYVYSNNIEAYDRFSPGLFFWEVVQATVRSYLGDQDEPDWRSTLDFMESAVRSGSQDERKAVGFHFLWNLPNRGDPGHDLVGELGPELTRILTRMQHGQPVD